MLGDGLSSDASFHVYMYLDSTDGVEERKINADTSDEGNEDPREEDDGELSTDAASSI